MFNQSTEPLGERKNKISFWGSRYLCCDQSDYIELPSDSEGAHEIMRADRIHKNLCREIKE